jgi:membrane-associated phospholipid phosphatase
VVVVLVSLAIFIAVPTRTVRPDTRELGTSLTADVYRNMVAVDGPAANAAPSLHVSLTCLLALGLLADFPRWRVVSVVGIGIIWLSTLLTQQHHLIDVASGVALALAVGLPWRDAKTLHAD